MPIVYTAVEDLLCDESFLAWYFKADPGAEEQWQKWMNREPQNRSLAEEAIVFLQSLQFREKSLSASTMTGAENRLLTTIHQLEQANKGRWIAGKGRWIAAACLLLLAGSLFGVAYFRTKKNELRTYYGEVRENRLPDGTEVTVNADSRITYSPGWKDGKDREVWLKGEAFFHVAKTPLKSRFIVHANHFDIIVTGTQFNVVSREDKSNVMLKEGSVILHTETGNDLKMAPGDFVEYHSAELEKRRAKTDSVIAWKDRKLVFDHTPVSELVKIVREHYGVIVVPADEKIAAKTISGIMPNDNLDVLLQTLEATGEYKILREKDTVIIANP
jgi:transmembrane sensor